MNTNIGTQEIVRTTRRNIFWRLYTLPWLILTILLLSALFYAVAHKPKPTEYYDAYTNLTEQVVTMEKEMTKMREAAMLTGNGKWITLASGSNQFVYTTNTNVWDFGRIYERWNEQLTNLTPVYESQKSVIQELFKLHGNLTGVAKELREELGKVKGVILKEEVTEALPLPPMPKSSFGELVQSVQPVHPVRQVESREVFTGKDYLLAESVNYDLEGDMIKNIRELISYETGQWDGRDKREFMLRLQNSSERVIRASFDGFRTYNRLKKE